MSVTLSPPAQWSGSALEQLRACYAYLYQMREQLQLALDQTAQPSVPEAPAHAPSAAPSAAPDTTALRALIVKNAALVEKQLDTLRVELAGQYVAQSDFGSYLAQVNSRIEADPTALTQYYSFAAALRAGVEAVDAAFSSYRVQTEGYIRTGVVAFDAGLPVYGVAVGQGLTQTQVDGETVVTGTQFRSVFTSGRLSFYQGDTELAYLSNNRLYVQNITVLGTVDIGDKWRVSTENGFVVRYIGGLQ